MEYHKTKEILHVMRIPGHKNIKNTLRYTQLIQIYEAEDDFVCKLARTPTEIQSLIETGFEYVCDLDSLRFFRKRKEKSVAGLCQNDVEMPRAGFEPATTRSSAERSPRLSYLGNYLVYLVYFWESLFIYLSSGILVYPFGKRNQSLLWAMLLSLLGLQRA